jgi:predicted phage baseplate assembly protein
MTGEVRFGNGQYGLVPQTGRNNLRVRFYRTGGGKQGNRPAGSVNQLKSAVPYVDKVTNHEAATGGADQETIESAKKRAPRRLRHRGRSVAAQDFEDLSAEASPDVARTLAVGASTADDAGEIVLIIVPRDTNPQPIPSLGLINIVEAYIRDRCAPTIHLNVVGPDWVKVAVDVQIVPMSLDIAEAVETAVDEALRSFLHPLTGGPDGNGWSFGRRPYESDLYALVEDIEGVDFVYFLSIDLDEGALSNRSLIFSGSHSIRLLRDDPGN